MLTTRLPWPPEPRREVSAGGKGSLVLPICHTAGELAVRCSTLPQVSARSHQVKQVLWADG